MADEEALLPKRSEGTPPQWLPRFSALIGLAAFLFQTTILYPWRRKLSLEVLNKTTS